MLKAKVTKKENQLEIIEYNGLPIAAKSVIDNTDVASFFLPVNVIIYLKRGRIKAYSNNDSFYAEPGDYFFVPSYSDYKIKKILDVASNDFESIAFFLDHVALTNRSMSVDFGNSKKLPPLSKLTSISTQGAFSILEEKFALKTSFSHIDLDLLSGLAERIMESAYKTAAKSISNDENDGFLSFLYNNIHINITLEELAAKYGSSTSSFYRLFVNRLGMSPHKWIKDQRLQYARCWMLFSQKPVSEIYLDLGFEDISHFSREFKNKFGYSPSKTTKLTAIDVIR